MGAKAGVCGSMDTSVMSCMSLHTGLIRAVGITPANMPEASVTREINADLEQQGACLKELHIDRAYLSSHFVHERSDELEIYCKAWPVREGKRFSKQAFTLDWERQIIRCPAEQEMPFVTGSIVHFPKDTCAQCPLKVQCTTSAKGRSVNIHPDEALLIELRERQQTPQGRAQLRERVEARAYPCSCGSMARETRPLSGTTQKSLRSAPMCCRSQSTRPRSFQVAPNRSSEHCLIT